MRDKVKSIQVEEIEGQKLDSCCVMEAVDRISWSKEMQEVGNKIGVR